MKLIAAAAFPIRVLKRFPAWGGRGRRCINTLIGLTVAMQLSACWKAVTWEEEVPLNTGEVIWVRRAVNYSLKGAGGNPLDLSYSPDRRETLAFRWRGKDYRYRGDADLMLIAISPADKPVLVAAAADKGWDWAHDYRCTTPHYVQFHPDEQGTNWTWPPKIEPWLYGTRHNLLRHRGALGEMKERYTAQQREAADAIGLMQSPAHAVVTDRYTTKDCKRGGLS